MKQIISRLLVCCCVLVMACEDNAGSRERRQHQNDSKSSHRQQHHNRYRGNGPEDPDKPVSSDDRAPAPDNNLNGSDGVIDRHPGKLIYTRHARCRMDCRHIDEAEVEEILAEGRINYRKSEPAGRPDPKYALEGTTRDGQQVRIIFAPAKRGMVVITVIDLDTDWSCNCK
ncbi:DUF4258 domain-containing protein [Niastella populi]|uniref:DUF4258 domain-containing protein n=1 Tax=Niastella populi TaxID=550983 RepID=UPI0009BFF987|nr:DUF4258 domain-containing protein [Niastella populi]